MLTIINIINSNSSSSIVTIIVIRIIMANNTTSTSTSSSSNIIKTVEILWPMKRTAKYLNNCLRSLFEFCFCFVRNAF